MPHYSSVYGTYSKYYINLNQDINAFKLFFNKILKASCLFRVPVDIYRAEKKAQPSYTPFQQMKRIIHLPVSQILTKILN